MVTVTVYIGSTEDRKYELADHREAMNILDGVCSHYEAEGVVWEGDFPDDDGHLKGREGATVYEIVVDPPFSS